jgi:hypothetical protein
MKSDRDKPLIITLLFVVLALVTLITQSTVSNNTLIDELAGEQVAAAAQMIDFINLDSVDQASSGVANCRYGVALFSGTSTSWISTLGSGWYLTFGATPLAPAPSNNAEFAHVIRVKQNKTSTGVYLPSYTVTPPLTAAGLASLISAHPGALWLVGNEVDRGPDPGQIEGGQDDTFPEIYATAYRQIYHYIKQRDPSARVANSALVQVTPNRLQYLDKVWNAYLKQFGHSMPVDVWNMHLYVLPEVNPAGNPNGIANVALGTNPALGKRESGGNAALCPLNEVYCFAEHDNITVFAEQVRSMRQWMKSHGQQNKPLILSEYSLLYPYEDDGASCFLQDEFGNCFTPARVSNFMQASFNYLETAKDATLGYPLDGNRLLQQWLWFSIYIDREGKASNLVNSNGTTLTPVGQTFQNHVLSQPLNRNLMIDSIFAPVSFTGNFSTVNVPLSVTIRNNGNTSVNASFTATFYSNAAMTTPIGSATIAPVVRGCATDSYTATVTWTGRSTGKHPFWVKVDSGGIISESNESDNTGTAFVLVDPKQDSLPVIRWR